MNQVSKMCRKVKSGKKTTGANRSLVNATSLQLECVKVCMSHC